MSRRSLLLRCLIGLAFWAMASLVPRAAAAITLSGNLFEDVTYTGGSGRTKAASSGVNRSGVRVELYNSSGAYSSATTTDASGNYSFSVASSANYTVRVVNSTVTSSLGGSSLLPVQTYRTTATSGSAVAVIDRVGGENPALADAGNGSTTLAALTTGSLTPQSITAVTAGASNITGLDFGFNFNTIVNVNNTGQGSLRQFMTNANGMSGAQTSVFMISDGSAQNGLRAGLTNQLTSGVAVISPSTAFPQITGQITIDGTSQTTNVGNTNSGTLGTGGTVGVDALTLSTVNRPEIEIIGSSSIAKGLDVQSASCTIKGIAIHGFGASAAQADIYIGSVASTTITQNIIGASATSFTSPAAATSGSGIYGDACSSAGITNNLIGFTAYAGILFNTSSDSATFQNNEVRGGDTANTGYGGFDPYGSGHSISGNLFIDNAGQGVDLYATIGGSTNIINNTITGNGIGNPSTSESSGLRLNNSNNTVDRNLINSNYGAGISLGSSGTGNKITKNSIYSNGTITNRGGSGATGQIGIDLQSASDNNNLGTAPYVTLNDNGDGDTGANNLLNFPVLTYAFINGSNLEVFGYAPTGATVELFISDGAANKFGQGQTWIGSYVEGGGFDSDTTTGDYSGSINGVTQGTETGASVFKFSFAKPAAVSLGTKLTATATNGSNNTSEFSGQVTIASAAPSFTLVKSSVVYSDPYNNLTNPKAIPGAIVRYSNLITNSGPGWSDADTVVFTDQIPTNLSFYVGDLGGAGSGPVIFSDGSPPSGLTYTFTSLSSNTDDLSFSNDNGSTWTYTPIADVNGCDANVTNIKVSLKGTFTGIGFSGGGNPNCTLQFHCQVK